jgi:hypothetical protein
MKPQEPQLPPMSHLAHGLYLLDSITQIQSNMESAIIVSGSHGGVSSASYVVHGPCKPLAVFFNDAGIGKDQAGIQALSLLQDIGVMCFCYSHLSARIGQAEDGFMHGVVSALNPLALAHAVGQTGQRVHDIVQRLQHTP